VLVATNGQRLLVATGASLGAIARACGVAKTSARRWKAGENIPQDEQRNALLDAFGIPMCEWDASLPPGTTIQQPLRNPSGRRPRRRPVKTHTGPTPSAPTLAARGKIRNAAIYPPEPPRDAFGAVHARHTLECVRVDLRHNDLTATARSQLHAAQARTMFLLANLEHERDLSEERYVRHPFFKAHTERVLRALRPFPLAARAVVAALAVHNARSAEPDPNYK